MDDSDITTAQEALDGAIKYVSDGIFENEAALINSFINDITNSGLAACGIDLYNDDTRAITGKDARNEVVKTAETIVPEKEYPYGGNPAGGTSRIRGLTVNWPASVNSDVERAILGALDNPWLQNCIDLIDESYALNFWEKGNSVRTMDVILANDGQNGTLAYVTSIISGGVTTGLKMTVNMDYYSSLNLNDWNGNASGGAAEVVHGIDDFRRSTIASLASNPSALQSVLQNSSAATGDQAYAGAG